MSDKQIINIFVRNLNYYMDAAGKSQADVARYMKVSTASVAGWCNGIIVPRIDKVQRLCDWLGIDVSDLYAKVCNIAHSAD